MMIKAAIFFIKACTPCFGFVIPASAACAFSAPRAAPAHAGQAPRAYAAAWPGNQPSAFAGAGAGAPAGAYYTAWHTGKHARAAHQRALAQQRITHRAGDRLGIVAASQFSRVTNLAKHGGRNHRVGQDNRRQRARTRISIAVCGIMANSPNRKGFTP